MSAIQKCRQHEMHTVVDHDECLPNIFLLLRTHNAISTAAPPTEAHVFQRKLAGSELQRRTTTRVTHLEKSIPLSTISLLYLEFNQINTKKHKLAEIGWAVTESRKEDIMLKKSKDFF